MSTPPIPLFSFPSSTTAAPSSTQSTFDWVPTAVPSDHSTLRIVATIVPIVVIIAITLWGLLVAGGIMHHQRRSDVRLSESTSSVEISEKWPEGSEPQLWEVSLKSLDAEDYHDTLHVRISGCRIPGQDTKHRLVAVGPGAALRRGSGLPVSGSQNKDSEWRAKRKASALAVSARSSHTTHRHRNSSDSLRTFVNDLTAPPDPTLQQAQVTVVVAMPSPRRHTGETPSEYAIGTREVLYQMEQSKREEDESMYERPIMLDMCAHGYIG